MSAVVLLPDANSNLRTFLLRLLHTFHFHMCVFTSAKAELLNGTSAGEMSCSAPAASLAPHSLS